MRSTLEDVRIFNAMVEKGWKHRGEVLTMAGNLTLLAGSKQMIFLDPNSSDRVVTLPAVAKGLWFEIFHTGSANIITVKNAGATVIGYVTFGGSRKFWSDGTSWLNNKADLFYLPISVVAASLANGQEFQFLPGYGGTLVTINARASGAVTTGAKAATVTGRVNAGALGGGGVVALAGAYAVGAAQAGTAITGAAAFAPGQTVGFTVGSVTTFVEGAFIIELGVKKL